MRILVAFESRPEIVKLGPALRAMRQAGCDVRALWTGEEEEDRATGLAGLFGIEIASAYPGAPVTHSSGKIRPMAAWIGKVLDTWACDRMVVHGNTATAAAMIAAGLLYDVPVARVDAQARRGPLALR